MKQASWHVFRQVVLSVFGVFFERCVCSVLGWLLAGFVGWLGLLVLVGGVLEHEGIAHAPGGAAEFKEAAVVDDAVNHGCGEFVVTEHASPS